MSITVRHNGPAHEGLATVHVMSKGFQYSCWFVFSICICISLALDAQYLEFVKATTRLYL